MEFMNEEIMKNLQQATERLGKLNVDQSNPWQSLNQMQQIFDQNFWNRLTDLTKFNIVKESISQDTVSNVSDKKQESEVHPEEDPSVDVFETLGRIIICCDLPGLDKNSLKISLLNGNQIVVQGKIKEHHLAEYRINTERFEGRFSRQIQLPRYINPDTVKSNYRDGQLELSFMKTEHHRKKSEVQIDL
ncbi:MAG TPA: Hsp20/alpha crystallin family protein [Bacillota bacterium]|nr:Hsp20/alpha crystallin family protein [Bacillota bacterium]